MKKLVLVKEQDFDIPNALVTPTQFTWESPIVTQILSKDSGKGAITRRGASLRAEQVRNAIMNVSIAPLRLSEFLESPLAQLEIKSAIIDHDVYGNSENQADFYTLNSLMCFAAKGRFEFDVGEYPTASVRLVFTSRAPFQYKMKIKVSVYERT